MPPRKNHTVRPFQKKQRHTRMTTLNWFHLKNEKTPSSLFPARRACASFPLGITERPAASATPVMLRPWVRHPCFQVYTNAGVFHSPSGGDCTVLASCPWPPTNTCASSRPLPSGYSEPPPRGRALGARSGPLERVGICKGKAVKVLLPLQHLQEGYQALQSAERAP